MERLDKILNHPERPVQLIFAGKAHPHDYEGKLLIQHISRIAAEPRFYHKIVFIENYDICVGRYLVEGVDVWLNNPLRPNEASGTSGMKAAANGVLNLSIADSWWAEANHLGGGWTIDAGPTHGDPKAIDKAHADAIYELLEKAIVPLFYQRNPIDDIPHAWVTQMKTAMQHLAPIFNTKRMVAEYAERLYFPAHRRWQHLNAAAGERGIALTRWKSHVRDHWGDLRIAEKQTDDGTEHLQNHEIGVGKSTTVQAIVHTDVLFPHELTLQIYHGVLDQAGEIHNGNVSPMTYQADLGGGDYLFEGTLTLEQAGLHGYTIRALPFHEDLHSPHELGLIAWA